MAVNIIENTRAGGSRAELQVALVAVFRKEVAQMFATKDFHFVCSEELGQISIRDLSLFSGQWMHP